MAGCNHHSHRGLQNNPRLSTTNLSAPRTFYSSSWFILSAESIDKWQVGRSSWVRIVESMSQGLPISLKPWTLKATNHCESSFGYQIDCPEIRLINWNFLFTTFPDKSETPLRPFPFKTSQHFTLHQVIKSTLKPFRSLSPLQHLITAQIR